MKTILRATLQSAMVLLGVYAVYRLDHSGASKVHGPLLIALAFIFVLQDSLFWLSHRKLDDFLDSDGLSPSELTIAGARVRALKQFARRIWLRSTALRTLALIAGIVLSYSSIAAEGRLALVLIGYLSIFAGILFAVRTYAIYQHADEENRKRRAMARETKAREEAAAAIRATNPTDWRDHPDLSGYGPKVRIKPK